MYFIGYSNDGSLLDTLRAYYILDMTKDKYTVVRFVLLRVFIFIHLIL